MLFLKIYLGFTPHSKDIVNRINIERFQSKIEPNKAEIFALSLKKKLKLFNNRHEKYYGVAKPRSKNLFDHVSVLGTLRSPSKVLLAYKEMKCNS